MFLQQDLFPPPCDWRPPRVSELVSFRGAKRVAYDVETDDPQLNKLGMGSMRDAEVVGFSYAIEDGPRFYVPLCHRGGDNVEDRWQAVGWLREEAKNFEGELVGTNLQYDLCNSLSMGVAFERVHRFRDVQIGEALIDEMADRYDLDTLCGKYGLEPKDEDELIHAAKVLCRAKTNTEIKKAIAKLPARYVGRYGEADADRPLGILRAQEKQFEKEGLWEAWELESRTIPALLAMRRRGILVDWDHLDRLERFTRAKTQQACDHVNTLHTDHPLRPSDLNRSEVLHRVLAAGGINNPYSTKDGKPSVTKEFLEGAPGEMGKAIREAKKWDKVRTTYIAGVRQHAINGRIHCTYNQTRGEDEGDGGVGGAATFRLSCKDPNLQAQAGRDPEIGPIWRKTYIPDEGLIWTSNDYSQQEPRFTTHFAAVMDLPRAREAARKYCEDPTTDNHQMMADLTGGLVKRKAAKEIYLGITYGQGGAKTATKIGLPTSYACRPPREWRAGWNTVYYEDTDGERYREAVDAGGYHWESAGHEAREIIETLEREVPYLKALAKECEKVADKRGSIRTFFGHIAHFPKDSSGGKCDFIRKALNRLIQTSSAGQTKKAIVDLHEAGEYIQLQVHDEIGGSVQSREHAEAWAEVMRTGCELMVPSKVDVETGPSWGDSMSEGADGLRRMMNEMEELGI